MLFDVGNTLLFLDPDRIEGVFAAHGVPFDRPRFLAVEEVARARVAAAVTDGQDGTEGDLWGPYFQEVLIGTGVPEDALPAVGDGLRDAHRQAHLWSWAPGWVADALGALKSHGLRVAAISNADGRIEQALEHGGLRGHLEFVIDSGTVGVAKPDQRIFRMACERLDLPADACAYVGDVPPVDVTGARGAGLMPVLVDPIDQFAQVSVARVRTVAGLPDLFSNL